jgi:hypothetical protein
MSLRSHQRNLVVWGPSAGPAGGYGSPRFTPPSRPVRIHRCIRTGVLLIVMGLMRAARSIQTRWRVRKRHIELARELAAYSTPAQRCDFEAILDRYPDDITYELRDILASQAMAVCDKRIPGVGRY